MKTQQSTEPYRRCSVCYDMETAAELDRNGGICGVCEAIRAMQATVKRKHKAYFRINGTIHGVRQPLADP